MHTNQTDPSNPSSLTPDQLAFAQAVAEHVLSALAAGKCFRPRGRGNGLKGPKTRMMARQGGAFRRFLKRHPVTADISRITRAHQCWQQHPEWDLQCQAQGNARGYSSYKALAAAR